MELFCLGLSQSAIEAAELTYHEGNLDDQCILRLCCPEIQGRARVMTE